MSPSVVDIPSLFKIFDSTAHSSALNIITFSFLKLGEMCLFSGLYLLQPVSHSEVGWVSYLHRLYKTMDVVSMKSPICF